MPNNADFLVEIGTEELPPNDLNNLSNAFADAITKGLHDANITFDISSIEKFATPRRLAVLIPKLATQQADQNVSRRGPAKNIAYNADGTPSTPALKFAQSVGVDFESLTWQTTDKGAWLFFEQSTPGKQTKDLLPEIITNALQKLPIKKRMRWGNGEFSFVRPMHWVLMLLGEEIIPASIFGIESSNITYGHRIHHPEPIKIDVPYIYADKLEQEGMVIANYQLRQDIIIQEINKLADNAKGIPVLDKELLNIVTGLVEYPIALLANFDTKFLEIPKECLISAMQHHQKCFALLDKDNKLLPKFILLTNLKSTDPDTIIKGNELVMHARLQDAQFHYEKDLQTTLHSRIPALKDIIYQKQLGTLYAKAERIAKLAEVIAPLINADKSLAKHAALLCKTDLVTAMVGEFPELQGIMGYYYAVHDKEDINVAKAIEQHYLPKTATDNLPQTPLGITLALADRIDSLVGFFGINLIPTGDKDPFGARRQALAIIRIVIDKQINVDLSELFKVAINNYPTNTFKKTTPDAIINKLLDFFNERMKNWFVSNAIAPQVYIAVERVIGSLDPLDIYKRINAVVTFQQTEAANKLTAANKRVTNLLKSVKDSTKNLELQQKLMQNEEEKALFNQVIAKEKQTAPLKVAQNYAAILQELTTLQQPVDNFFESVMVNVEDQAIKNNRIILLQRLRNLFTNVADISLL